MANKTKISVLLMIFQIQSYLHVLNFFNLLQADKQ